MFKRLGYGTGHILNDMCASMWFTYMLLFFHNVIQLGNNSAGLIVFIGQIADGISTVFVGVLSDREYDIWIYRKYGKRKSWHLMGTICVLVSFPFLFMQAIGLSIEGCDSHSTTTVSPDYTNSTTMPNTDSTVIQTSTTQKCEPGGELPIVAYYSAFVVLFQFGWATVQISHLSMIPDITSDEAERMALTSVRYAATVMSNLLVYGMCWLLLELVGDPESDVITPEDKNVFLYSMLFTIGLGGLSSLLFHFSVKPADKSMNKTKSKDSITSKNRKASKLSKTLSKLSMASGFSNHKTMKIWDWFMEPQFYLVACIYMSARLFVNVSQSYITFYVQYTVIGLDDTMIAVIPMIIFVSGFIVSVVLKFFTDKFGHKIAFVGSCVVGLCGCIWVLFGCEKCDSAKYEIFAIAALLGAGGSAMLINCLAIVANLIASNIEGGGFVYGAMSFVDKVSCGIALMLIQNQMPDPATDDPQFFESVIVYWCGGAAIFGVLIMAILWPMKLGQRWRDRGDSQKKKEVKIEDDSELANVAAQLAIRRGSALSTSSRGTDMGECPPEYEEYLRLRNRRRSNVADLCALKTVLKEECDDDNEFIANTIKEDEEAPEEKY